MPTSIRTTMKLAALVAVLGLCAACTVQPDPPDDRARVEWVVESHLLRFAFREGLDVRFR